MAVKVKVVMVFPSLGSVCRRRHAAHCAAAGVQCGASAAGTLTTGRSQYCCTTDEVITVLSFQDLRVAVGYIFACNFLFKFRP